MRAEQASYWNRQGGGKVLCRLCPHECLIEDGNYGICHARQNVSGALVSRSYGMISAINIDPVEKKPLFHFHPGAKTLSFGSFGCNFRCGFCQNYTIAAAKPSGGNYIGPEDAVYFAAEKNIRFISYTYNEPLTNYEWVYETSEKARKKGIENILVTNGYVNEEPLKRLADFTDAANVDIKAFNDDFYSKICGASLRPVLKSVELLHKLKVHVEITSLIIDSGNSNENEFRKMTDFIAGLSEDIPLHLSRYFPVYKFTLPPTKEETLLKFYDIAKEKLKYVYLGNISNFEKECTYCKKCGFCIIERDGYNVKINVKNPRICPECGTRNNIIV